ncbi:MAG TPA: hypothetical protein VJ873_02405 [bacterium]|nr:hypothetical protein [bacterium]
MKRLAWTLGMLGGLAFLAGCSLSPDEKVAREQALQQAVLSFSADVVQGSWPQAYALTDGTLGSSDQLKSQLMKSWVQDATLTNGDITSLAWVTDSTAKVKLTWSFQAGSVQSFSNETFIWVWKGNGWKYKGRALM